MDAKPYVRFWILSAKDYNDTMFSGLDKFLINWAAQTEGTLNSRLF